MDTTDDDELFVCPCGNGCRLSDFICEDCGKYYITNTDDRCTCECE